MVRSGTGVVRSGTAIYKWIDKKINRSCYLFMTIMLEVKVILVVVKVIFFFFFF